MKATLIILTSIKLDKLSIQVSGTLETEKKAETADQLILTVKAMTVQIIMVILVILFIMIPVTLLILIE